LNVFNQLSIWLSFQLSIIFLVGLPVTLFFWSIKKRNKAVNKLLSIYWKISLLFFISLLLLIGKYNYALVITNISTLLITISIWFWNDINDELKEYDFSYSLTTTTKIWRWSLTFISLNFLFKVYRTLAAYLLLIQLHVKYGFSLLQTSILLSKVYLTFSSELTLHSL